MHARPAKSQDQGFGARAREWLRRKMRPPRRLRITRTGRTYLMVTLGVGMGALNTGNNLLYLLLGLLLSVIILSGLLSERALRDLTVERLGTDGAFAKEPSPFRWALRRKRGHAFALEVREVAEGVTGHARLAWLPPGPAQVVRGQVSFPRRGPTPLSVVEVSTEWPLGLFNKSRRFDLESVIEVFPARVSPDGSSPTAESGPVGDVERPRHLDGQGDLAGLRELADGEDARRIHWLKSATAGRLLRTEREREEHHSVTLEMPVGLTGAALERACERLAAEATRLIHLGHEVGMRLPGRDLIPAPGTAQLRRLLRELSRIGFESPQQLRDAGGRR